MKEKQLHWSIPNVWTWHWTERETRFQKQPLSSALLQINATPCNDLIFADGLWFYYFSSSLISSYGQQYWWFYCQSPESKFVQKSYLSSSFPKPLYCLFISTINIDHYLHISIAVAVIQISNIFLPHRTGWDILTLGSGAFLFCSNWGYV